MQAGQTTPLTPAPVAGARREYLLTLAAGAAGAALVLLCTRQAWARVMVSGMTGLPPATVRVSGQALVPLAGALGLVSLAGLGALIATRGLLRRLVAGVLALAGVLTALAVSLHLSPAAALGAARQASVQQAGSVTAGGTTGISPGAVGATGPGIGRTAHVVMMTFPWQALALLGSVLIVAAGAVAAWRCGRWPALSSRYEPPGGRGERTAGTTSVWEALSRGADPTDQPPRQTDVGS